MRVTNKMMTDTLLANIGRSRSLAGELSLDITTTKKLRKPSDDPAGLVQVERYKTLISRNEQFKKNITHIKGFTTNSTSALDNITNDLETAKELAVQGASETVNAEARQSLANNVDQIINNLVSLGNSTYKGKFIFGGTQTSGNPPFSRDGDNITYSGNGNSINGEIGFNAKVSYNQSGDEVFNPPGGPNIFAELVALRQALESDDTDALNGAIASLDQAHDNVLSTAAELGAMQNRLSSTEELIQSENLNLAEQLSKLEDTDVIQAIVESQALETAISAGLNALADVVQTSLVDFVG